MIGKITGCCALLVLSAVASAQGAGNEPKTLSAYNRVMQAQYAAKEAPLPARPEEAQRIYESYLRSIGQPAKDRDAGGNAGMPSR